MLGKPNLRATKSALELPGTYGIAQEQIVILLAGGAASLSNLAGGYEDDMDLAREDVRKAGIGAGDCLVSVSASGSTPYALAAADEAALRSHCRDHLAQYKVPREVRIIAALPRNPTGKILRRELKAG